MTFADLRRRFPYLIFRKEAAFHWDAPPAGIIAPRRLIAAQIELARLSGAEVIKGVAVRVERRNSTFTICSSTGHKYASGKVLVATGSYTNRFCSVPRPLDLEVRPETVVLMEVQKDLQRELCDMPSIIWNMDRFPGVAVCMFCLQSDIQTDASM